MTLTSETESESELTEEEDEEESLSAAPVSSFFRGLLSFPVSLPPSLIFISVRPQIQRIAIDLHAAPLRLPSSSYTTSSSLSGSARCADAGSFCPPAYKHSATASAATEKNK